MSDKITNIPTAFDDESLPPPDWDPAMDADDSWNKMVTLMRNADEPPALSREDSEGIRAALKQQLTAEGILRDSNAAAEPSALFGWLKGIFLGGGAAGQTLRLGAVAAIAVAATAEFSTMDTKPAGRARSLESSSKRELPLSSEPKNEALSEVVSRVQSTPAESLATNRNEINPGNFREADAIAAAPPAMEPESHAIGGSGDLGQLEREKKDKAEFATGSISQNSAERQDTPLRDELPKSMMAKASAPAASRTNLAFSADTSAGSGALISQAMEALQAVKLSATLGSDRRSMSNLDVIDRTLAAAMSESGIEGSDVRAVIGALDRYRSAEELLEAKNYTDAEATFVTAHEASPDSFIGFLALFQTGRIRYEFTQDFAGALSSYRRCLDDYPRQFMPDDYRAQVRDRVETLNRTASNNWEDLRAWSSAETAPTPRASADFLVQLLADNPTSYLAPRAAQRLTDLLIEDAAPQTIEFERASSVLAESVRRREVGPETARIQFCIAELQFRRALSPAQAIIEYQKALEMKPDAELRTTILERLKSAASERLVLRTEPEAAPRP